MSVASLTRSSTTNTRVPLITTQVPRSDDLGALFSHVVHQQDAPPPVYTPVSHRTINQLAAAEAQQVATPTPLTTQTPNATSADGAPSQQIISNAVRPPYQAVATPVPLYPVSYDQCVMLEPQLDRGQIDYLRIERHQAHQLFLLRVLDAIEKNKNLHFTVGLYFEAGLPEASVNILRLAIDRFRIDAIGLMVRLNSAHIRDLSIWLFKSMNDDIRNKREVRIDRYPLFLLELVQLNALSIPKNFFFHFYLLNPLKDLAGYERHKIIMRQFRDSLNYSAAEMLEGLDKKQLKGLNRNGMNILEITSKDVKAALDLLKQKSS